MATSGRPLVRRAATAIVALCRTPRRRRATADAVNDEDRRNVAGEDPLQTENSIMTVRLSIAASVLALAGVALAAQAAESVGQAASSAAKKTGHAVAETGREVGHATAEAGRKTGHAVAETGRDVGHAAGEAGRDAGHATAEIGRKTGHAAAETGRKTGHAVHKETDKAKAAAKSASSS
jgi:hypothetical protein